MLKLRYLFTLICILLIVQQNIAYKRHMQIAQSPNEEDIFESVDFSHSFQPLTETFCDKVIASYPKKVRQIVDTAITNKLKQNFLILHGASGTGKSLLARIITQKNGKPFLTIRSYFVENKTSENLCKVAIHAARTNCNVIIEGIEEFIKEEINLPNRHIGPLSEMLKILQHYNLLLIGVTFKSELLEPLQHKIDTQLCKLETPKDTLATVRTINAILSRHGTNIDSPQTIVDFAELVIGRTQCTIKNIIRHAYEDALVDVPVDMIPTITLEYLKAALKIINYNTALLKGQSSKKENTFHCSVQ